MTTTPTTDLQGILAAKKAEIVGQSGAEYASQDPGFTSNGEIIDVTEHGEIVPGTAVEPADANPPVPAVPAPVEVRYPEIPPKVVGGLPYISDYWQAGPDDRQHRDGAGCVPGSSRRHHGRVHAGLRDGTRPDAGPRTFDMIQGKVGLTAEAMRALDHRRLGTCSSCHEGDGYAEASAHRNNGPSRHAGHLPLHLDDARLAGLTGKD